MDKGEALRNIMQNLFLKRLLILVGFAQLLFELESSHLFLWPLDHSCARSQNLTNVLYFSEKPIKGDDVQANLFSATTEDSFTVARATSLGINYDDIASCYEYPVEFHNGGDAEASMYNLEPCQHGLYFEQPKGSLSVVAQFHLACERQRLKVLLMQCIGSGLLIGSIFTCCLEKSYSRGYDETTRRTTNGDFLVWLLLQILVSIIVLICTDDLARSSKSLKAQPVSSNTAYHQYRYAVLLTCSFGRSFLAASCLVRSLKFHPGGLYQGQRTRLRENLLYFHLLAIVYVTFRALYYPIASRIFTSWTSLNSWLTMTGLMLPAATAFCILLSEGWPATQAGAAHKMPDVEYQLANNSLTTREQSADALQYAEDDDVVADKANGLFVDQRHQPHHGESMADLGDDIRSYDPAPAIFRVCEFCLLKRQQVHPVAAMNGGRINGGDRAHNNKQSHQHYHHGQQCSSSNNLDSGGGGCMRDDSSTAALDQQNSQAYQPTTVPISCLSAQTSFSGPKRADGGSAEVAHHHHSHKRRWPGDNHGAHSTNPTHHSFRHVNHHLLARPIISQVWLLTFCVAFNYFLFCTLPDHKLLHPESILSRKERRQSDSLLVDPHHLVGQASGSGASDGRALELVIGLQHDKYKNVTYDLATPPAAHSITSSSTTIGNATLSDHRSINYSTQTIDCLYSSNNPILILWTTVSLNGWPVELLAILLHAGGWLSKRFEPIYFKLNSLMMLVKFGSRTLIVEWILIAILRGQNHLIELDWFHTVALLLARCSAVLMIYNYFHTMLKLSRKLGTGSMVKMAPTVTCVLLAFIFGSLAPILEKINLVIIPIALIINNSLAYLVAMNLNKSFKHHLCPMMFEDSKGEED